MAVNAILWVVCPFLVLGGLVGVYEYTLYSPQQRARAPTAARIVLGIWLGSILAGLAGLGLLLAGTQLTWAAYYVVLAVALAAPLAQRGLHRTLDVDRSPLLDRHL